MLGPLLAMPSGQGLSMTLLAILKVNGANWLSIGDKTGVAEKSFYYWQDITIGQTTLVAHMDFTTTSLNQKGEISWGVYWEYNRDMGHQDSKPTQFDTLGRLDFFPYQPCHCFVGLPWVVLWLLNYCTYNDTCMLLLKIWRVRREYNSQSAKDNWVVAKPLLVGDCRGLYDALCWGLWSPMNRISLLTSHAMEWYNNQHNMGFIWVGLTIVDLIPNLWCFQ